MPQGAKNSTKRVPLIVAFLERIAAVFVQEGDRVKAGQVLARLATSCDLRSQSHLSRLRSRLDSLQISSVAEQISAERKRNYMRRPRESALRSLISFRA